ncbi:cellulose synthase operon protein C [Klebsiella pneumoniae]|uniref:Cellulose synthase operon protein C n=1 Tax=Klebsiella pneumoniae TaxID=573 RepID=A0A377YRN7_KLEPN|nr:cellulose synthase operon protein C [Klebsiella pneumoniae]
MKPSPPMKNCTAGCRMTLTSPLSYWTLVARLPARHSEGVSQLKKLNASAPGNVSLLTSLAKQMFADNKPQEGFAYLAEMARSASGRGIAADMWFSEVKSMPVSKASVQALQQFLLQFPTGSVAANARVLLDQQQAQLQDPTFRARSEGWRRSSPGIPRRRSRICRKPFRPTAATATRWALSARPIPSAATARGQWRSSVKRLPWTLTARTAASGTACCKLNRYWLLIKQGDNALKAGQLRRRRTIMPRRSGSIAPTAMPCWGWGTSRRRAKRRRRRSAITSRRCAWIAAITWRCAAWPTSIAPNRRRKPAPGSPALPPAQRREHR